MKNKVYRLLRPALDRFALRILRFVFHRRREPVDRLVIFRPQPNGMSLRRPRRQLERR